MNRSSLNESGVELLRRLRWLAWGAVAMALAINAALALSHRSSPQTLPLVPADGGERVSSYPEII